MAGAAVHRGTETGRRRLPLDVLLPCNPASRAAERKGEATGPARPTAGLGSGDRARRTQRPVRPGPTEGAKVCNRGRARLPVPVPRLRGTEHPGTAVSTSAANRQAPPTPSGGRSQLAGS